MTTPPQDDLTAERAAAEDVYYGLQAMNTPDYNLREADMKRDIQAIITLIRQTRQEALREYRQRIAESLGLDHQRNSEYTRREIIVTLDKIDIDLDRLASEGG
jgi:hypothetical protein